MIVKAINQDEFRDFSFVNHDWRSKEFRNISETCDLASNSLATNTLTQPSLATNATSASSNYLTPSGSSPTSKVIFSASKCDTPSSPVRSRSPLISDQTISTNTSLSNITNNQSSTSLSSLNPTTATRTIQNTDI